MAGMGCDRWRSFTQPEHLCNGARKAPWGMDGLGLAPEDITQVLNPLRESYQTIRTQELQAEQAREVAKQQGRIELAKIEAESRTRQAEARAIEAATVAGKSLPVFGAGAMPAWALPALAIGAGLVLLLALTGKKRG